MAISTAVNITNKTSSVFNESVIDDDESFYTVDVLLVAGGVFAG
jgi:hypothetical protein